MNAKRMALTALITVLLLTAGRPGAPDCRTLGTSRAGMSRNWACRGNAGIMTGDTRSREKHHAYFEMEY
jgi:hypothetical protein